MSLRHGAMPVLGLSAYEGVVFLVGRPPMRRIWGLDERAMPLVARRRQRPGWRRSTFPPETCVRAAPGKPAPSPAAATARAVTCFRCDRTPREDCDRLPRPARPRAVLLLGARHEGQRRHRRLGGYRHRARPAAAGVPAGR